MPVPPHRHPSVTCDGRSFALVTDEGGNWQQLLRNGGRPAPSNMQLSVSMYPRRRHRHRPRPWRGPRSRTLATPARARAAPRRLVGRLCRAATSPPCLKKRARQRAAHDSAGIAARPVRGSRSGAPEQGRPRSTRIVCVCGTCGDVR